MFIYLYNRPAKGLELAREGLQFNPGSAKLHYNLGEIYLIHEKDCKLAVYHLKKAIALSESEDGRFIYLVMLYQAYKIEGRLEDAIKLEPELAALWKQLGVSGEEFWLRELLHEH